jgi:adenylate cyclase
VDESVQMTRVIASSMARIAEAMVSSTMADADMPTPEAEAMFALTVESIFDTYSKLIDYVWRRHLQAVLRRQLLATLEQGEQGSTYAVGFADLVGFTALSQELSPAELAGVVTRFEDLAFDHVARHGGRVAKVIGDEVMFVVRDTAAAVETGLDLAEAYADDEVLSDVRVGIACGDVLAHEGDYYGPVVNLASRIVNIAVPGSVVVSPSVRETLGDDDGRYVFHGLRPRQLKDIGRVRLWRVRRGHPSR